MKKVLFTFILLLVTSTVGAYDVRINGLYYNLVEKAKVAEVTTGDEKYAGAVEIPLSHHSSRRLYGDKAAHVLRLSGPHIRHFAGKYPDHRRMGILWLRELSINILSGWPHDHWKRGFLWLRELSINILSGRPHDHRRRGFLWL